MKKQLVILVFILLKTTGLFAKTTADSLDIFVPRAHNPAFVQPGGTFTVEIRDTTGSYTGNFTALLRNDLRSWPVAVKSAKKGRIDHDTENGWQLTIGIPANVPPELMELELKQAPGVVGIAKRSVSIVPNLETDFYILQQSDEHITLDMAAEPGGKSSTRWGNGSKQALLWLTPVINLINPRFVLHTGDNMHLYNEWNSWCGMDEAERRVNRFMRAVSTYTAPTVIVTGNHDIGFKNYMLNAEWRDKYKHIMGQKTFSFRMGSFYVLASEWTNSEFLNWAKTDYNATWADPSIKYRMLAAHYFDGLNGGTTVVGAGERPCDVILVGHNHVTKTLQTQPYYALSTGTAQDHQRASFFDFKRTASGWTCPQFAAHADGVNVHKLVGDNGAPTVSAIYTSPNDGTAQSNSVSITNQLPHNFYNGRVRFLMPKGQYGITGGEILAQYDYNDGKNTSVLVKVNIKGNGITQTAIKRK